ncbi:MAG: iron-containing alcohol dehydrogenase [Mesorhizobium sp.]|nr:MAG: iron-containing alcohol dehydrogenase [Mesorhizobium sp.]
MSAKANWNYSNAVRIGAGRIAELLDALKATGIQKPLLVTDAGLANLSVTQNTVNLPNDAGFEVGVSANSASADVNAGVEILRKDMHDGAVAFGGSSGLNVGKVIAFMADQTQPMWAFDRAMNGSHS